ncbi:helix-turn-helix domain-containing protein [Nigerium massiliense]|uniref:helix-turn-helix domain-containing protein n=1 Tax=Nigerium massiliense TaxID=1522317 RepID=UPI00058E7497|nr:helix-turn-helix domain-containing protein [Nigerium massiliense]
MPDSGFLTLQEAVADGYAAYSTLRKYIAQGKLPAVKMGARIKVRRRDLDALLTPARPTDDAVDVAIARMLAVAPPLSTEQIHKLRDVLAGA